MRAFLSGVILMVVIGVIAWAGLGTLERSSSEVYQSDRSVRL